MIYKTAYVESYNYFIMFAATIKLSIRAMVVNLFLSVETSGWFECLIGAVGLIDCC